MKVEILLQPGTTLGCSWMKGKKGSKKDKKWKTKIKKKKKVKKGEKEVKGNSARPSAESSRVYALLLTPPTTPVSGP